MRASSALRSIPVTGGTAYNFGAAVYLPPGTPAGSSAAIQVYFHSSPSCEGAPVDGRLAQTAEMMNGQWQLLSGPAEAPDAAVSAQILLQIVQFDEGAGYRPLFDRVYLSAAPATF